MGSLSCVVIGDADFPKELGKIGSHSDIALYHRKVDERIYSFILPLIFPEKLSSLLVAVRLSDAAIVVVKAVTPDLGEAIIALNEFSIKEGIIILDGVVLDQVKPILKGTVLEGYSVCERSYAAVMERLSKIEAWESKGSLRLPLDHFFLTKTIGTVAVGKIERGMLKEHDKLTVLPTRKEVLVKSLESQEVTIGEAGAGVRVGVALKGIEPEELGRGFILTDLEQEFIVSNIVSGEFTVNRFQKQPLEAGQKLQIALGLQSESVVLKRIDGKERLGANETARIELMTETGKKLVYEAGERFIIFRPELKGLRIVGSGIVKS